MAKRKIIDVSDNAELRKFVEDVAQGGELCSLVVDGKEVAVISPGRPILKRAGRTKADREAFLSSAGGWKGLIDAEEFKKQIRESRSISRPPVDL